MVANTFRSGAMRYRWLILTGIFKRPWVRVIAILYGLLSAWDLALSQLIPDSIAARVPKLYQLVEASSGYLSPMSWLLIGAGLVTTVAVEFAARQKYPAILHSKDGPLLLDVASEQLSLPISEASLSAYVRSSRRLRSLDEAICRDLQKELETEPPPTHVYLEYCQALKITTIGELDRLVSANATRALRMSHYMPVQGPTLPAGYGLQYLFTVLGAQLGAEQYWEIEKDRKWGISSRGWVEGVIEAYNEIQASARR